MKATFAGGCFWCMVPPFEDKIGIRDIVSGYANGTKPDPTYMEVYSRKYGFYEAVQIDFDEKKISYKELLEIFWRQIDPTDSGGQFADRGQEYMTAILYHDEKQRKRAEQTKRVVQKEFDEPIATKIIRFENFYPAEEEHQDYHSKNPMRYNFYKIASGRAGFLKRYQL